MPANPPPQTQQIFASGVGKSSLISSAFGVEIASVSHNEAGKCDIQQGIQSAQNKHFVVHDSQGFEPGNTQTFNIVKEFLEERCPENAALADRVHVIWLCVQTPYAGARKFETGDEQLLTLAADLKIPIVLVFTQYDRLITRFQEALLDDPKYADLSDEDAETETMKEAKLKANVEFEKQRALLNINESIPIERTSSLSDNGTPDRTALDNLIKTTRRIVGDKEDDAEGDAWIVGAVAQRSSAMVKIEAGIAVGMKKYWIGLTAGAGFKRTDSPILPLQDCLNTVHEDMTDSWNFYDPNGILQSEEFKVEIRKLVQFIVPETKDIKTWFNRANDDISGIQTLLGFFTGAVVGGPVGTAIAAITLAVLFIQFIAKAYQSTPETLRCFMGYITDLTLVLNQLFQQFSLPDHRRALTEKDIKDALEVYRDTELGAVHRDIREYVRVAQWGAEGAEGKVKDLIWEYTGQKPRSGPQS